MCLPFKGATHKAKDIYEFDVDCAILILTVRSVLQVIYSVLGFCLFINRGDYCTAVRMRRLGISNAHICKRPMQEKDTYAISEQRSPMSACLQICSLTRTFLVYLLNITKTSLYNIDPLKPHFYIVKLGFIGVYIIFLISAQKHRLWVLVRTASSRRF